MNILIALLFALTLLTASARGSNSIQGAFGVLFGQTFDMTRALSKDSFTGHTVYEFSPTERTPIYDRYYLSITPQTNKIYGICGVSIAATLDQAKENHRSILQDLQRRFGQIESGLLSGIMNMFGLKRIEQGEHKIVISFREDSNKTYVIYYNDRLKRQARLEEERHDNR